MSLSTYLGSIEVRYLSDLSDEQRPLPQTAREVRIFTCPPVLSSPYSSSICSKLICVFCVCADNAVRESSGKRQENYSRYSGPRNNVSSIDSPYRSTFVFLRLALFAARSAVSPPDPMADGTHVAHEAHHTTPMNPLTSATTGSLPSGAMFVTPSSYLRRTPTRSQQMPGTQRDRPIDRDERQGLVSNSSPDLDLHCSMSRVRASACARAFSRPRRPAPV